MGVQACRLPALKPLKPLKRLKRLKPLKPLKLCKSFAERPTAQAKATPRPHPSLLLGAPACRSPGVTRFKPFKRFNILLACLIPQPTGTPRPHQWLLMGVQACRLPALKPLKPLKTPKTLKTLKTFKTLKTLQKLLGTPTRTGKSYPKATSIASSGRPSLPFASPKPLKPLKRLKRLKPAERPTAQAKATPRPHPSVLKGVQACRLRALKRFKTFKPFQPFRRPFQGNSRSYTPQPSVFRGSSLPFARPQTLQTLQTLP